MSGTDQYRKHWIYWSNITGNRYNNFMIETLQTITKVSFWGFLALVAVSLLILGAYFLYVTLIAIRRPKK